MARLQVDRRSPGNFRRMPPKAPSRLSRLLSRSSSPSARTSSRAWRAVARRYGFEEYDGPPLEPLELYTEKSGDEIVGQLYNFDGQGRPRGRAAAGDDADARADGGGARQRAAEADPLVLDPAAVPLRAQQTGRLREHFQLNGDLIGEAGVAGRRRDHRAGDRHHARVRARARRRARAGVRPAGAATRCWRRSASPDDAVGAASTACSTSSSASRARCRGEKLAAAGVAADAIDARARAAATASTATTSSATFGGTPRWRSRASRASARTSTALDGAGPRRVGRARPDDRARPRVLHRHRVRAVRRRRASCAPSAAAAATTTCSRRSAASTCPRSASAWATSCSASCSRSAACCRRRRRRSTSAWPRSTTRTGRTCCALAHELRDAGLGVEYALRRAGVGQAAQAGRRARARACAVVIGPRRSGARRGARCKDLAQRNGARDGARTR